MRTKIVGHNLAFQAIIFIICFKNIPNVFGSMCDTDYETNIDDDGEDLDLYSQEEQPMIIRYRDFMKSREQTCSRILYNEGFIYLTPLKNYMYRFLGMTEYDAVTFKMPSDPVCLVERNNSTDYGYIFEDYEKDKCGIEDMIINKDNVLRSIDTNKPSFLLNYVIHLEHNIKYASRLAHTTETFCLIEECKVKEFTEEVSLAEKYSISSSRSSTSVVSRSRRILEVKQKRITNNIFNSLPKLKQTTSEIFPSMIKKFSPEKSTKSKLSTSMNMQNLQKENNYKAAASTPKNNIILTKPKKVIITNKSKILKLIKVRNDCDTYENFFDYVIEKTGMTDKREIKCTIHACISELMEVNFGHLNPEDNINKNSLQNSISDPLKTTLFNDYQQRYYKHLMTFITDKKRRILNMISWCICETCLDELARFGLIYLTTNENVEKLPHLLKEPIQYINGIFVNEFRNLLQKSTENKTITAYCAERACLAELTFHGFEERFDGSQCKRHLNTNYITLNSLKDHFIFLRLYIAHLQSNSDRNFRILPKTSSPFPVYLNPLAYCREFFSGTGKI